MNGIKTATGDDVESMIQASFSLEIFALSKIFSNTGPTIRGVPKSEKKMSNSAKPSTQLRFRTCINKLRRFILQEPHHHPTFP